MKLVFKVEEETLNFLSSLPRTRPGVVVPEGAEDISYYVDETADTPAELITEEEFVRRGYHECNFGGWVTMVP